MIRNGIFGVTSTALSGLSNVLVQLIAGTLMSAQAFGRFSLAASTILLVMGAGRMIIGQTDMLRGRPTLDKGPSTSAFQFSVAILVLGIGIYFISVWLQVELVGTIGFAIAISGIFVLRDCARLRAFRLQRSGIALISDALVLAIVLPGMYVCHKFDLGDRGLLLAWAAATLLGAAPAIIALRYFPSFAASDLVWIWRNRDLVGPVAGEYALQSGFPYALNWVVLWVGGLEAVAGYRLIQVLFSVVSNLAQGMNAVLIPRIINSDSPILGKRFQQIEIIVLSAISAGAVLILAFIPEAIGEQIFGNTWTAMLPYLLPGALHGYVNALSVSNFSLLRLLGHAKFSLLIRSISVLISVPAVALGAVVTGAPGIAWAMALVAIAAYALRRFKAGRELVQRLDKGSFSK